MKGVSKKFLKVKKFLFTVIIYQMYKFLSNNDKKILIPKKIYQVKNLKNYA